MSTSIFNPRLFESRFIALNMAVCVYYFYLQWPNFALNGDYRGADPSVKLSILLAISSAVKESNKFGVSAMLVKIGKDNLKKWPHYNFVQL